MQRKTKTWWGIVAALVALGGVVNLFEGGADKATADNATPSAAASASAAGAREEPAAGPSEEAAQDTSGVPLLDVVQREVLLRALRAIEPELAVDEDRAVERSRNVCLDLRGGKAAATVQINAKSRFEDGTAPSLTEDQAASIVTAVRSSFCE
ncbi:hypothetical protein ACIOJD_22855 [Streptomyces sp. NPDC088116]|uniref:hypothetical protein n=1 Tax=Streptomyces sp. NPDC088116 TaxID=3365825 RepID=UPI00382053F2